MKDRMNFNRVGEFQLNNKRVGEHLTDSVRTDISIVQFGCRTGCLDISGVQPYHVSYKITRTGTAVLIGGRFV